MKHIYSVLTALAVCLSVSVSAQVAETFENPLPAGWRTSNTNLANPGINQKSISFTNNGTSTLETPFLDFNTGAFTISLNYALTESLKGNGKNRSFQIGYQNKTGAFVGLTGNIAVTAATSKLYTQTFSIPNGVYRIVIKGFADGSNEQVLIDNLSINANFHYAGPSYANSAPTAVNDLFFPVTPTTVVSGNVTLNDTDPNAGEAVTNAVLVTAPLAAEGNLVFNADGSFTFTPAPGFTGGLVSFTYRAIDNGYEPATSANTATVRLNYPIGAPPILLPVKLVSFNGSVNKNRTQLEWLVAENETAKTFEVQKSTNGTDFTTVAIIHGTQKSGNETYTFTETISSTRVLYRLKMYDQDSKAEYSKVLAFNTGNVSATSLKVLTNPVKDKLVISFTQETSEVAQVTIYDNQGRIMQKQNLNAYQGVNTHTIALNGSYRSGLYIVELVTRSGKLSEKIIYSNQY